MPDFSVIVDKLKSNKLLVPALAIGGIAGGYFLLKGGGLSGGADLADSSGKPPSGNVDPGAGGGGSSGGDPGAGGGGGQDAIAALQQGQSDFMRQITDLYNQLASGVQSAISQSAADNQNAIQDALNSIQGNQQQGSGGLPNYLPDFSALYNAMQSVQQQPVKQSSGMFQSQPAFNLTNSIVKSAQSTGGAWGNILSGIKSPPQQIKPTYNKNDLRLGLRGGILGFLGNLNSVKFPSATPSNPSVSQYVQPHRIGTSLRTAGGGGGFKGLNLGGLSGYKRYSNAPQVSVSQNKYAMKAAPKIQSSGYSPLKSSFKPTIKYGSLG